MPKASPNGTETELALAVRQGVPAAKWARTTGVPSITAWRWAKDPVILPFAAMPVSLGTGLGNRFEFVSCQLSVVSCKEGTRGGARLLPLLPGLDQGRFWGNCAVDTPGFTMPPRSWRSQPRASLHGSSSGLPGATIPWL